MINRINNLFKEKKKDILSIYFTAGFPELNNTLTILKSLQDNGADLVEIGIPFSDPLADGPVIQQSSATALKSGMNLGLLFDQLSEMRNEIHLPVILMGYLNPIMQFGVEKFCKKCADVGVDGVILPDLPIDFYQEKYQHIFEKHNLKNIFLITPQTSEERIRMIDNISDSFIYMVSFSSITGGKLSIENQSVYFEKIEKMKLNNPRLIGFGISDKNSFQVACKYANGAIIGTAFIQAISNSKNLTESSSDFVSNILK